LKEGITKQLETAKVARAWGIGSASWDSITSEELAARLARFAEAPAVDETGLTGEKHLRADSCARLCGAAGGELEQIFRGHVSIQTTAQYLGCTQQIA